MGVDATGKGKKGAGNVGPGCLARSGGGDAASAWEASARGMGAGACAPAAV